MDRYELDHYLHEHIPLSQDMGVEVVVADWNSVTLRAPLAPNINHRETVFGGSASAVAIPAAWALICMFRFPASRSCPYPIQTAHGYFQRPPQHDATHAADN